MRFLEKVGPSIENKLEKAAPEKKPQEKPKAKGGKITKEDYDEILSSFKEIMAMEEVPEGATHLPSNRIKLMIKNTLQRQTEGWPSSGQNTELKTKEQIEEAKFRKVENRL